jgi:hypothetical protein
MGTFQWMQLDVGHPCSVCNDGWKSGTLRALKDSLPSVSDVFCTPNITRTTFVSLSHSVCARVNTTWYTYKMCILLICNSWPKTQCLYWDHQHSDRSYAVRWKSSCDSISPSALTVGLNFRWLAYMPSILPAWVSGHDSLHLLWTHLSGLLEDVSFDIHLHIRFQHDGGLLYYIREVGQWPSENCPACRIGHRCEASLSWPAHPPDLNSLIFFLWKYFKIKVCVSTVGTREELWCQIHQFPSEIKNTPRIFKCLRVSF